MGLMIKTLWNLEKVDESLSGQPNAYLIGNREEWSDRNIRYAGYFTAMNEKNVLKAHCSTYNRFRSELCQVVYGHKEWLLMSEIKENVGSPFLEIFDMNDCDGSFDSITSKKLSEDFQRFRAKAKAIMDDEFFEIYEELKRGFELATAKDGVVLYS